MDAGDREAAPADHDGRSQWKRSYRLGPLSVEIGTNDRFVAARFDDLLEPLGPGDPAAPVLSIRVDTSSTSDGGAVAYVSAVDGETALSTPDLHEQELWLTRVLNKRRLDAERWLLHLHSAAVARGGRAVLMPGGPGVGKSTLAAAMVQRGWDYLTDEQGVLRPADGYLLPYPRPITLRESSWSLFAGVAGVPPAPPPVGPRSRIEVAPRALGRVAAGESVEVSAIVFPRYVGGGADALVPVSTVAEAVEGLAASSYDLERLGAEGLAALAGLAARCPAWRLEFDDLDVAVRRISEAFAASPRVEPAQVRHIPPAALQLGGTGTVARARGAHAWLFGDGSSVVYEPGTRTLARLDAAGSALWECLDEPRSVQELCDIDDPSDPLIQRGRRRLLDTLVKAGLLEMLHG